MISYLSATSNELQELKDNTAITFNKIHVFENFEIDTSGSIINYTGSVQKFVTINFSITYKTSEDELQIKCKKNNEEISTFVIGVVCNSTSNIAFSTIVNKNDIITLYISSKNHNTKLSTLCLDNIACDYPISASLVIS